MKKYLLLMVAVFAICGGTNAYTHITPCGKGVTTVGVDFFDGDQRAFNDYLRELDEAYCGPRTDMEDVSHL